MEGLSGRAAYLSGDPRITVNILDLYLAERVKEPTGGRQAPTTASRGTVTGFPIALRREGGSRSAPAEAFRVTVLAERLLDEPAVARAARDLGILLVYLWGSQARGKARPDSDVDLAVLLDDRRRWAPEERLEHLDEFASRLAAVLDLPRDRVDVQDLEEMPVTVAFGVAEHGRCLYQGEEKLDVCCRAQLLSRYQDFRPIEDMFRAALHRRLEEGRFGR